MQLKLAKASWVHIGVGGGARALAWKLSGQNWNISGQIWKYSGKPENENLFLEITVILWKKREILVKIFF